MGETKTLPEVEIIDKIIHARRSTRAFQDKPVPRELIGKLLEAAIWAPSGGNNQSWLFTAVRDRFKIDRLNELVRQALLAWTPDDDYPGKAGAKKNAAHPEYHCFYHAPAVIILSNKPGYENAMADCSLALENIFLMAEALGLGSCYINQPHWVRHDEPYRDYLATFGIPKEHVICSSAAIGYSAKPTLPTPRKSGTIRIID
jgi:nitroreductase